jgi:site-specific DNA recombinase
MVVDDEDGRAGERRDRIREVIAEENRKDIIERLWKGRQERVRRGLPPGGNVPYGYRRERKRFVRDEAEAEVIRLVFEFASSGGSAASIAGALNAKGFLRRSGKPWTQRQVSAVLSRAGFYREGLLRYGEVKATNPELALIHAAR